MAKGTWRDKCAECGTAKAGAAGTDLCWPCLRTEVCCSSPREAAARGCGCQGGVGQAIVTAGGRL